VSKRKLVFSSDSFLRAISIQRGQYETMEHHTVTDGILTAHATTKAAALRLFGVHVHSLPSQDLVDKVWTGHGSWL